MGRGQEEQKSLIHLRICHGGRIVAASRREFPDQLVMSVMGLCHIQNYHMGKKFFLPVSHICHRMGSGGMFKKEWQD